jgi:hypothetical protein
VSEPSPEYIQEPLFPYAMNDRLPEEMEFLTHEVLYSEAELARAYLELDPLLPDYTVEKLHKACLQARKNRVWDRSQK